MKGKRERRRNRGAGGVKTCDWCGFGADDKDTLCANCGRVLGLTEPSWVSRDAPTKESRHLTETSTTTTSQGTKQIVRAITSAVVLIGLLFFILSFHVVVDIPIVVPKDSLSFNATFVSVEQCVDRWNKANILQRIKLSQTNLYQALERRKLIQRVDPDNGSRPSWEESQGRDTVSDGRGPLRPEKEVEAITPDFTGYVKVLSHASHFDSAGTLHITGTVKNTWSDQLHDIKVGAMLYSRDAAVDHTDSNFVSPRRLQPGQTGRFEILSHGWARHAVRYELTVDRALPQSEQFRVWMPSEYIGTEDAARQVRKLEGVMKQMGYTSARILRREGQYLVYEVSP